MCRERVYVYVCGGTCWHPFTCSLAIPFPSHNFQLHPFGVHCELIAHRMRRLCGAWSFEFTRAAFLLFFIWLCVLCGCMCVCVCVPCCDLQLLLPSLGGFVLLPAAENKSKLLWHIIFIAQHFGRAHFYCQLRCVLCMRRGVCTTTAGLDSSNSSAEHLHFHAREKPVRQR